MTENSRFWDGLTIGDAVEAPYDAGTEFSQYMMSISHTHPESNRGGVFIRELNNLEVSGVGSPITIATGRALVYGTWYQNDAAYQMVIPTPAVATRKDRIVLRKSWTLQTVRITRIAGVEGGGAPAITQVAGDTWDLSLAQISVTVGGVITVTDERKYVEFLTARQGNGADWYDAGITKFIPTNPKMQCGSVLVTIPMLGASSSANVTFPIPFVNAPLVFISPSGPDWDDVSHNISIQSNTGFTVVITVRPGGVGVPTYIWVQWLAVGQ